MSLPPKLTSAWWFLEFPMHPHTLHLLPILSVHWFDTAVFQLQLQTGRQMYVSFFLKLGLRMMYKLRRQYTGKGTPINKKITEPLQTKQNTITGAWWFFLSSRSLMNLEETLNHGRSIHNYSLHFIILIVFTFLFFFCRDFLLFYSA
jgi:hypothetical protein